MAGGSLQALSVASRYAKRTRRTGGYPLSLMLLAKSCNSLTRGRWPASAPQRAPGATWSNTWGAASVYVGMNAETTREIRHVALLDLTGAGAESLNGITRIADVATILVTPKLRTRL